MIAESSCEGLVSYRSLPHVDRLPRENGEYSDNIPVEVGFHLLEEIVVVCLVEDLLEQVVF